MSDLSEQPQSGKHIIDKILDSIYRAIEIACALLLLVMVFVIAYTVFFRFVLNDTPTWGEQLGIFCMVWIALLGSSLAIRDGRHIRMSIIEYILPAGIAKLLHKLVHLFMLLVGLVFIIDGLQLMELSSMSIMGSLGISSSWLTLSLPVSGTAIIIMLIARFRRQQW